MASSFLWHTQEVDSVSHELKADLEQGLSSKEAASRLVTYGPNELPEVTHTPWVGVFFRLQISLMIPILVLASAMLILANLWTGAFIVMGFLLANVILGGFQVSGSENILRSLKKLANRSTYARVLRSGHVGLVKTVDLVPGDIICFEKGQRIAADARLIEANHLIIDESAIMQTTQLTEKQVNALDEGVPIHEITNMVFMGTTAVSGSGRAMVTSTGLQTQVAQIVTSAHEAGTTHWSMLETKLSGKGLWFAGGCLVCSALLWGIMMAAGVPPLAGGMVSLSFLMAAWPVGLIEAAMMALTTGMKHLSERQVVIREFSGAEALAEATVLCSDKTGIMTHKQMTVKKVFVDGRIIDVEGEGYSPESGGFPPDAEEKNLDLPFLLTIAAMCTNTEVKNTPEGWSVIGDPTEGALVVAAMKGGINRDELGLSLTKITELPFDSERKRMTTVFRSSKDEIFVFTRGSLETVLDISVSFQLHGHVDDLDIGRKRAVWAVDHRFARDGMQSMAFAYCQLKEEPEEYTVRNVERSLVFMGMAGIVDPLRSDAKLAVEKCLTGGLQPIILTDDHVDTTFATASALEMTRDGSEVLAGEELDILGDKEYSSLSERFVAYADVSSAHKVRIIRALKGRGATTAVIVSHISDAAVIHEADIGMAIGLAEASVITDASDIILMDNNFATAVSAVEGMRGAYGNARKIIRYLLSGSMATVITILVALIISVFHEGISLTSSYFIHTLFFYVLWINLLAGSIPALAMILDPAKDGVMKDGPYSRGVIIDDDMRRKIPIRGAMTALLALFVFVFSLGSQAALGRAITAAFTVLVMSQLAFAFHCRRTPDEGFFRKYLTSKLLLGLALLVILLHISILYVPPVSQFFRTESLQLTDWILILIAFVICSFPLDEVFDTRMKEELEGEPPLAEEEHDEVAEDEVVEEDTAENSNEEPRQDEDP